MINIIKVTQLIILLITITTANNHRSHLAKILKTQKSFLKKTNENIHNILNKMLESLNIDANFTAPSEIKLLLTMHFGLNNIAEKTCEVYDEVRNTIRLTDNKTANKLFTLNVLNEILDEKPFKRRIIEKIFQITEDKIETRDIGSEEVDELTNDYLMKLNILNIKDLRDKDDADTSDDDMSAPQINLKVWDTTSNENSLETRRVFKGTETNVDTYPFIVSVHVMGEFTCAGSIISTNLVITAASCLQIAYNNTYYTQNADSIVIRVGSDYISRGGNVLPVLEVYFHPSYDPVHLWNNLAIMRTQKRLRFSKKDKNIRRILVNRNTEILPVEINEVMVLGWGAKDEGQTLDPFQKISIAKLEVFNIEECKKIYSSYYVSDKHFCAGYLTKGGGTCNRDIGGPGVINKFLSGVVSFASPTCGAPNSPTVFMNLGHYAGWIDQILRQDQTTGETTFSATTGTTENVTNFMRTVLQLNRNSTSIYEVTTNKTTNHKNDSDIGTNDTTVQGIGTKVVGNTTEINSESRSELSDNYEDQSNSSSSGSAMGIALNSTADIGSALNETDDSSDDGNYTEANISEMNERYGDDNVFIWNTEPKEVQIRKFFKN